MLLANDFLFSANNLQDYLDCPRRFELKYILKQSWPAISSLPVQEMEYKIRIGNNFHKVIHQYLSGIPTSELEILIKDEKVKGWFEALQKYLKPLMAHPFFSEYSVISPINGFRFIAVFDFISFESNKKILIADWKTTARKPKNELFMQSIQSVIYPLIAYETRSRIFIGSEDLNPEDFSLKYFFPEFPDKTISLDFNKDTFTTNKTILLNLINEITNKESGAYEKTANDKRCAFCQYRSLCERGIQAGKLDDQETSTDTTFELDNLDFEQIEEIPF
jgi:hypothetical protein